MWPAAFELSCSIKSFNPHSDSEFGSINTWETKARREVKWLAQVTVSQDSNVRQSSSRVLPLNLHLESKIGDKDSVRPCRWKCP